MGKKKKIKRVRHKHFFGDNARDQRNIVYGVVALSAIDALSRQNLRKVA